MLGYLKLSFVEAVPDEWLTDPVFWLAIGGPAILLIVASLYFFRLDSKAGRLFKSETGSGQKMRMPGKSDIPRLHPPKDSRPTRDGASS